MGTHPLDRIFRAGTPATMENSSTLSVTTAPAPTMAPWPILTLLLLQKLIPIMVQLLLFGNG